MNVDALSQTFTHLASKEQQDAYGIKVLDKLQEQQKLAGAQAIELIESTGVVSGAQPTGRPGPRGDSVDVYA